MSDPFTPTWGINRITRRGLTYSAPAPHPAFGITEFQFWIVQPASQSPSRPTTRRLRARLRSGCLAPRSSPRRGVR
jgi:hypothetical protein